MRHVLVFAFRIYFLQSFLLVASHRRRHEDSLRPSPLLVAKRLNELEADSFEISEGYAGVDSLLTSIPPKSRASFQMLSASLLAFAPHISSVNLLRSDDTRNMFLPTRMSRSSPSMIFNRLRTPLLSNNEVPLGNAMRKPKVRLPPGAARVQRNLQLLSNQRLRARLRASSQRVTAYRKYDNSSLSRRLDSIIYRKPSLSSESYRVTPWLRGSRANFGFATLRSRLGVLRQKMEPPFSDRISSTTDPDVKVEWAKDPIGYALPDDAPIVIFLHTVTGTAAQSRWLMRYASSRGWRSCTFVRRGHGGPLHSPSFDVLGTVEDVQLQLDAVKRKYPESDFLAMVGVSAGSGQLLSYLGRAGSSTPIGAASGICPAWNTGKAFAALQVREPLAEKAMLGALKKKFLSKQNRALLRAWDARAFEACVKSETLPEFIEAHAPFAMRDRNATVEDYYTTHNPMADRHGIKIPVLLINSEDDFVCSPDFVRPDVIVNEQPGTLLLMPQLGSHVAFNEGLLARDAFHLRTSFDFFDGARETSQVAQFSEPETSDIEEGNAFDAGETSRVKQALDAIDESGAFLEELPRVVEKVS